MFASSLFPAMGLGDVRWHYSNNLTFRTQPTVASSPKICPAASSFVDSTFFGPQAARPQVVHQHLQHRPGSLRVQQEWWLLGGRNLDSPSIRVFCSRNLCIFMCNVLKNVPKWIATGMVGEEWLQSDSGTWQPHLSIIETHWVREGHQKLWAYYIHVCFQQRHLQRVCTGMQNGTKTQITKSWIVWSLNMCDIFGSVYSQCVTYICRCYKSSHRYTCFYLPC